MAAGFNFRKRDDAEKLLDLLRQTGSAERPLQGPVPAERATHGWIFQTPSGGIPARSGVACGKADCTPYQISTSGDLEEVTDNDGSSQTIEIYNIFSSAIEGDAYITVKEVFGALVVDAEDCDT